MDSILEIGVGGQDMMSSRRRRDSRYDDRAGGRGDVKKKYLLKQRANQ